MVSKLLFLAESRIMSKNTLLRQARLSRGWTQQQIALQLHVEEATVRSWERGDRFPAPDTRQGLCLLFNMTPEELGLGPQEDFESSISPIAQKKIDQPKSRLAQKSLSQQKGLSEKLRGLAYVAVIVICLLLAANYLIPHMTAQPSVEQTQKPVTTAIILTGSSPTPTNSSPTSNSSNTPLSKNSITELGSLDFQSYCTSMGNTQASLDQKNAYGWRCITASGGHVTIDVDALCRWQYSGTAILAVMTNSSDPDDWRCYGNAKRLGSANFADYCQSLGETARLDDTNAYGWRCLGEGEPQGINMNGLCRWQYHEPDAIARVTDAYNPNGWECLGSAKQ